VVFVRACVFFLLKCDRTPPPTHLDDKYPLIVPEINGHLVKTSRLIANPNCTTGSPRARLLSPLSKLLWKEFLLVSITSLAVHLQIPFVFVFVFFSESLVCAQLLLIFSAMFFLACLSLLPPSAYSHRPDGALPVVQGVRPEARDHVHLPGLEWGGRARHERT